MCVGKKMPVLRSGYVYVNTETMKVAIEVIRKNCHVTSEELSTMLGKSRTYVSGLVHGDQDSAPTSIIKVIAKKAGIPYESLLLNYEEKEERNVKDIRIFEHAWLLPPLDRITHGALLADEEETRRVLSQLVMMPEDPRTYTVIKTFMPDGFDLAPVYIAKADNNGNTYVFCDADIYGVPEREVDIKGADPSWFIPEEDDGGVIVCYYG